MFLLNMSYIPLVVRSRAVLAVEFPRCPLCTMSPVTGNTHITWRGSTTTEFHLVPETHMASLETKLLRRGCSSTDILCNYPRGNFSKRRAFFLQESCRDIFTLSVKTALKFNNVQKNFDKSR